MLKELPIIGIKYLTQLFNAVLLKGYFLAQWIVTPIILILKSGKPPNGLTSYQPISLLPTVSTVFEKLLLKISSESAARALNTVLTSAHIQMT
jgi:hypothetical protein